MYSKIRSIRVLILDSKVDKVFCAGADLKERAKMSTDQVQRFVSDLRQTFTDLESLSIPTVSVINGVALGGGLEMAFKELKNEYATLIYLNRLSGVGHMATIVRLNDKLMVFDPQVECICHNIGNWLDKEGASAIGAIFVVGKHVHCREQTNVCVSKDKSPVSKRVKMLDLQAEEAMIPRWKPKEVRKKVKPVHITQKERAFNHFKDEMTRLGFERYLD